ncbi:MAG: protein translocase subunit SecF [Armatimonadota bacterium]
MDFFRRQNWDLVGRSSLWFIISGILFVGAIIAIAAMGLNLGIDFTGGGLIRYEFAKPIAADRPQQIEVVNRTRQALEAVDLGLAQVLVSGNDELIIRTPLVANDEEALAQERLVRTEVEKLFGAEYGPILPLGRESVGPVVGSQLRRSATNALILGVFLILLYITLRYQFRFAVAAIVALVHDVIILIGFMAVLQLELDSTFVAVILTVIGFSVHDTIVIFDRIRENVKLHRRADFADTVNASLLQTMSRSIYTGVAVLFMLAAMGVLGSGSIRVFSIAMVIGIALGSYSSIFNASQIVVVWERWRRPRKSESAAAARRRERAPRNIMGGEAIVETGEDEESEEVPAAAPGRKLSAQQAMARAEEMAQEEKREERRARRKAKDKAPAGKSKKRF